MSTGRSALQALAVALLLAALAMQASAGQAGSDSPPAGGSSKPAAEGHPAAPAGQRPSPAPAAEIAEMSFQGAEVADVFHALGELAGLNVLVDRSASGTVTFFLRRLSPMQAIDLVARATGLAYRVVDNTLVVATPAVLKERFADEQVDAVELNYLDLGEAERLVRAMFPDVQVASLPRARTVWLRGPRTSVEPARALLKRHDVPSIPELEFTGTPLTEALKALARAGGFNFAVDPAVGNVAVTAYFRPGTPVSEALDFLAQQAGLRMRFAAPGQLVVQRMAPPAGQGVLASASGSGEASPVAGASASPAAPVREVRSYPLRFLSVAAARQLLSTSGAAVEVTVLEERRTLLLRGLAPQLDEAIALLRSYDRPTLRAAGVIQVGDQFRALLEANGVVHLVRVGSRIGDLEVVGIDPDGVRVQMDGETFRVPAGGGPS